MSSLFLFDVELYAVEELADRLELDVRALCICPDVVTPSRPQLQHLRLRTERNSILA